MSAALAGAHVAMFIDYDNAQLHATEMGLVHCRASQLWVSPLIAEIERITGGVVDIRRCYGNTLLHSGRALADKVYNGKELRSRIAVDMDLQQDLLNNGFVMVHTPSQSGKNRADILMALDCMEVATKFEKIDTFAILSHDSDFSPLIHRLRALGKDVVWITIGDPTSHQFRGKRSLECMATHRVVFDQSLVDNAGYGLLMTVLEELKQDPTEPLRTGVALSTIHSRILSANPRFSYEDVGFSKLKDFVDACIEEPFIQAGAQLRLMQPGDSALAVAAAVAAGDESVTETLCTPREREFAACLNKQKIRPLPDLRRRIAKWMWDHMFDECGTPLGTELTYADLQDAIEVEFHDAEGVSKSKCRDVLRLLYITGLLQVSRDEQLPMKESRVIHFFPIERYRKRLAAILVRRLEGAGMTVTQEDMAALAQVIFGSQEPLYLEVTQAGFDVANEVDEDDDDEACL